MEKVLQQLTSEIATLRREVNRLKLMEVPSVTIWTDWTPTVTQSGSVTITVTFARYTVIQNTVTLRARLAVTSAGTTGNAVVIGSFPFSANNNSGIIGVFRVNDAGIGNYVGALQLASATSANGLADGLGSPIGVTPNFALASGDTIDIVGTYERD